MRSLSPRALALMAVAVTVALALAGFVAVMSAADYRRTGTTSRDVQTYALLPPGEQLCQPAESVPAGSRGVGPVVKPDGARRAGPLSASVAAGGRVVATGRSTERFGLGVVRIPLDRTIAHELSDATVCFHNDGAVRLRVFGDYSPPGAVAAEAPSFNQDAPSRVQLDWFGARRETGWQLVPTVAERFPLVKARLLGPWTFWLALVVLALISAAAVWRTLREVEV